MTQAKQSNGAPLNYNPYDLNVTRRRRTIEDFLKDIEPLTSSLVADVETAIEAQDYPLEWASRIIESIMVDLPLGPFNIDRSDGSSDPLRWFIIDGQMRLSAIVAYYYGVYHIQGSEFYDCIEGLYYKELPGKQRRRFRERYLDILYIDAGTPEYMVDILTARLRSQNPLELDLSKLIS